MEHRRALDVLHDEFRMRLPQRSSQIVEFAASRSDVTDAADGGAKSGEIPVVVTHAAACQG